MWCLILRSGGPMVETRGFGEVWLSMSGTEDMVSAGLSAGRLAMQIGIVSDRCADCVLTRPCPFARRKRRFQSGNYVVPSYSKLGIIADIGSFKRLL